ncbi:MAG: taurine dioxygenase, partial [Deltaproteobacteria bacterium]|nr:taurine dioxygenase [Deltaproteobacteria bacterium]
MALEHHPDHVPVPDHDLDYSCFDLATLTPHIGAEIRGLDLSAPFSNEQEKEVRRALQDWMVLVFRDQELTHEQHEDLGRRFGELHIHPQLRGAKIAHPEILPVHTNADSPFTPGDGWHADVTCEEIPLWGSMLYIRETPACGGGDTLYADMYMAYELLSDPMKKFLSGLTAVHDGALPYVGAYKSTPPEGGYPQSEHPVIRSQSGSDEKILYVNSGFTSHIKGLSARESR